MTTIFNERISVEDASDVVINPATSELQTSGNSLLIDIKSNQTSGEQKTQIVDNTNAVWTLDIDGNMPIIQRARPKNAHTHFHVDNLGVGTHRFIIVDISDTVNYHHDSTLTDYIHIEWFELEVDASNVAEYNVTIGFLANVDADNGDFYGIKHISGNKTAGNSIRLFFNPFPNGHRCKTNYITTHRIDLNDVNYQNDILMKSTRNPDVADTYPGDGDLILEIVVTAGTIDVAFEAAYHSH